MAKKKKSAAVKLTPEQQLEADYQKAVRRMEGAEKMLQAEDKLQMYKQAVQMFAQLGDYKDSMQLGQQCEKKIPQARKEYRAAVYQSAVHMKEGASSASDYDAAIEEFQKLKQDYKDVNKQVEECKQLKVGVLADGRRKNIQKKVIFFIAAALAIALVFWLRTPSAFYTEGKFFMGIKKYKQAGTAFARSREYKDAQIYAKECHYLRALQYGQQEKYKQAAKVLRSQVGDYKDAAEKLAQFELQLIKTADIGDTVNYGTVKWIVADATDEACMLVQKKPEIQQTVYQASGRVTWETSDLRAWLNGAFYGQSFSEYERAAILQTRVTAEKNSVYGTPGGAETEDAVFLLDEKEALQYRDRLALKGSRLPWWLRTPGKASDSAAYVSAEGDIMYYGYAADSNAFAVRPAVWVSIGK